MRGIGSQLKTLLQLRYELGLSSPRSIASSSTGHNGFLEMREYTLHPSGITSFLKLATETTDLRARLLPFLG